MAKTMDTPVFVSEEVPAAKVEHLVKGLKEEEWRMLSQNIKTRSCNDLFSRQWCPHTFSHICI